MTTQICFESLMQCPRLWHTGFLQLIGTVSPGQINKDKNIGAAGESMTLLFPGLINGTLNCNCCGHRSNNTLAFDCVHILAQHFG